MLTLTNQRSPYSQSNSEIIPERARLGHDYHLKTTISIFNAMILFF